MMLRHVADCPCLPSCQICLQCLKRRPSYCDIPFFKMAAGRHLGFCCSPKVTPGNVAGCPTPWPPAYQIWWRYLKQRLSYVSYEHFHFFSKWRPSAILDSVTGQKWRHDTLRTVHVYHRAKFVDNISNGGRVIAILRFSKWRPPPSWIWLDFTFILPTKSTWWPEAKFKFLSIRFILSRILQFQFSEIWLKMPIRAQKWGFWGISPLNISGYNRDPKKHFLARNHAFWHIDRQNRSTVATCRRGEVTNKKLSYRLETGRQQRISL